MSTISFDSLRINPKVIILIQVILSFSFAVIVLYPNLSAQWNVFDDHEIIDFLGKDHNLSFKEIPGMLMKTEAGFHHGGVRYRPIYFLMKLIETATWGNNPLPWYAFRIVLFGASIFIAWLLLGRFLGVIAGGLACLLLLAHPFWGGWFLTQLGPSEIYGMIGLALYCLAFVKLWDQQTTHTKNIWWCILAFGAILCMGSKENFLLLLPATAIPVYRAWKYNQLNKISIFTNLLLFIFGIFVTLVVVIALKNKGMDVNFNTIDPESRIKILLSGFFSLKHWKIQLPFWFSLILVFIAILFHKFQRNKISAVTLIQMKRLFLAEAACLLVWYSQFVFYSGIWPTGIRYDFPGVLAQDLAYVFLVFSPLTVLRNLSSDLDFRRTLKVMYAVLIISLSVFIMRYGINNYKNLYDLSIAHRDTTQTFAKVLMKTMEQAKENPTAPIVFVCNNVYFFEPIFSTGKFLVAYDINNPLVVVLKGLSESICKNIIELNLLKALRNLSDGKELPENYYISLKPRFYSAQSLPQPIKPCITLVFP